MSRQPKTVAKSRGRAPLLDAGPSSFEWVGLALILVTTFLVYLPAIHGGLLMDDEANITLPGLRPLSGLKVIWFEPKETAQYYPLIHTVLWIEHRLWGDSYVGYHLVTLLWHGVNVTLLYVILRRLKVPGVLLAAAIFALHPVMVESVAWMCEQKNTLSTLFYLSALLTYLKFDESRRRSQYFLALGLCAMALLTKTITVTLPAALLVIFWWQRGTLSWRRDVAPLVPFFVLGAAAGLMTVWVERRYFHGEDADFILTLPQRILLAGRAIWFYLGKLAWPANLMFNYPRWTIDPSQWWQWLFPFAALAVTFALWSIRSRWRAPLAGWLFFCGTLLPVVGLAAFHMLVITYVADHLQYLASLGMIVLAAAVIHQGIARLSQPERRVGVAFCLLFVGILAVLTLRQSRLYGDVVLYYQTLLTRNPDSWLAHNNLGLELSQKGNYPEAIEHYEAALRIRPNYVDALSNLGVALTQVKRFSEASANLKHAIRIKPDDSQAHLNLGSLLIATGHDIEAIEELKKSLALNRDSPDAHYNMGISLTNLGRYPEAIEHFQESLRLRPNFASGRVNLGVALVASGKNTQAIEQFRLAIELQPNDANAHSNLGFLLHTMGDVEQAITHLNSAITLQPDSWDTHSALADAYRVTTRFQDAIVHYSEALRLKPDFVHAYAGLAQVLAIVKRSDEAQATAQKGVDVARATGDKAAAERLEEWLEHYRKELRRSEEVSPSP